MNEYDAMLLPAGKTCRDCKHFKPTCEALIGLDGDEISCDWSPSKFAETQSD